ncbi:hypothetical protein AAHA92_17178 [Salvia divinorum]|uniref:Uncharacterized protein n=1 Tax=Salvia divinorum TaxID=28513 RepID=A0ABD1GY32_SALDI
MATDLLKLIQVAESEPPHKVDENMWMNRLKRSFLCWKSRAVPAPLMSADTSHEFAPIELIFQHRRGQLAELLSPCLETRKLYYTFSCSAL